MGYTVPVVTSYGDFFLTERPHGIGAAVHSDRDISRLPLRMAQALLLTDHILQVFDLDGTLAHAAVNPIGAKLAKKIPSALNGLMSEPRVVVSFNSARPLDWQEGTAKKDGVDLTKLSLLSGGGRRGRIIINSKKAEIAHVNLGKQQRLLQGFIEEKVRIAYANKLVEKTGVSIEEALGQWKGDQNHLPAAITEDKHQKTTILYEVKEGQCFLHFLRGAGRYEIFIEVLAELQPVMKELGFRLDSAHDGLIVDGLPEDLNKGYALDVLVAEVIDNAFAVNNKKPSLGAFLWGDSGNDIPMFRRAHELTAADPDYVSAFNVVVVRRNGFGLIANQPALCEQGAFFVPGPDGVATLLTALSEVLAWSPSAHQHRVRELASESVKQHLAQRQGAVALDESSHGSTRPPGRSAVFARPGDSRSAWGANQASSHRNASAAR